MDGNIVFRTRRARPAAVATAVLTIVLLCLVTAVATGNLPAPARPLAGPVTPSPSEQADGSPDTVAGDGSAQDVERSTRLQRRSATPSSTPRATRAAAPRPTPPAPDREGDAAEQPLDESARALADKVEAGLEPVPEPEPAPAPEPAPTPEPTLEPTSEPTQEPEPAPVAAARFRVASFNVLGASHTAPGGNKAGWAPAARRIVWAVQLLRGLRADLIGFQELELPQHADFQRLTDRRFGVFPGPALGRNPVRNSIAWSRDTWQLKSADTIALPYFHGNLVRMPFVRLQHRSSGRQVNVINIHNPATTRRWGDNERWRDLATAREIRLANRLRASTGAPVLLMGDFNERQEVFCRTTGGANMRAANGGSSGRGRCVPPATMGIDWIFGSPGIRFSDYARHQTDLVRRTTDHPVVVTGVQLSGQPAG
jgi:endonuclease/exonuclease/phosphatase family metal-dependent hydrolase